MIKNRKSLSATFNVFSPYSRTFVSPDSHGGIATRFPHSTRLQCCNINDSHISAFAASAASGMATAPNRNYITRRARMRMQCISASKFASKQLQRATHKLTTDSLASLKWPQRVSLKLKLKQATKMCSLSKLNWRNRLVLDEKIERQIFDGEKSLNWHRRRTAKKVTNFLQLHRFDWRPMSILYFL